MKNFDELEHNQIILFCILFLHTLQHPMLFFPICSSIRRERTTTWQAAGSDMLRLVTTVQSEHHSQSCDHCLQHEILKKNHNKIRNEQLSFAFCIDFYPTGISAYTFCIYHAKLYVPNASEIPSNAFSVEKAL